VSCGSSGRFAGIILPPDWRWGIGRVFGYTLVTYGGGDSGNPDLPVAGVKRTVWSGSPVGELQRLIRLSGFIGRFGSHIGHYGTPFPLSSTMMKL
jgi:hypothetical protein